MIVVVPYIHHRMFSLMFLIIFMGFLFNHTLFAGLGEEKSIHLKNGNWYVDGDEVIITYDLEVINDNDCEVSITLKNEKDASFHRVHLDPDSRFVKGDCGKIKLPGPGMKVRWRYKSEYPNGFPGEGYYFSIEVEHESRAIVTKSSSFNPPQIRLSATFHGSYFTDTLESNDQDTLTINVANDGIGSAQEVNVFIDTLPLESGITIMPRQRYLGELELPQKGITFRLQLLTHLSPVNQTFPLFIHLREATGYYFIDETLHVYTEVEQFAVPTVVFSNLSVSSERALHPFGSYSAVINRDDTIGIELKIRNTGKQSGENVIISWESFNKSFDEKQIYELSPRSDTLGFLPEGIEKDVKFRFCVSELFFEDTLKVRMRIREKRIEKYNPMLLIGLAKEFKFVLRTPVESRIQKGVAYFQRGLYSSSTHLLRSLPDSLLTDSVALYLAKSYEALADTSNTLRFYQIASSFGNTEAMHWVNENTETTKVLKVSYRKISPGVLEGIPRPISLGIAPIHQSDGRLSPMTDRLYNAMKGTQHSTEIFTLYPPSSLEKLLSPNAFSNDSTLSLAALKVLNKDEIQFVLTGTVTNGKLPVCTIQIINTSNGVITQSQRVQDSETSTAIHDAILFIYNNLVPQYRQDTVVKFRHIPKGNDY